MSLQTKPTLLIVNSAGISNPVNHVFRQYFNLETYQTNTKYNPKSTIVYFNCQESSELYKNFCDQNFSVVIDNLWEKKSEHLDFFPLMADLSYANKTFLLHNVNWFWYNESFWYFQKQHNQYQPRRTYEKLAFMPMRLERPGRNMLYGCVNSLLDQFVWSYVAKGKHLPNDADHKNFFDDRYFNPAWYDSTCFSLVAETYVDPSPDQPVFVTEKTFKPLAFKHPFMVFGNAGTLEHLHSLGFETYENLFDESYDKELVASERCNQIVNNIQQFKKQPYDHLTLEKIEHNFNHFFDLDLVTQRMTKEIIEPILEYANF